MLLFKPFVYHSYFCPDFFFFFKFRVLVCLFTLFLSRRRAIRDGCLSAGGRGWGLRTFMECSRDLVTSQGAIHVLSDVFSCL